MRERGVKPSLSALVVRYSERKMADHNRVAKELRECQKDTTGGITVAEQADVQAGCMAHWSGTIKGPVSSPYEGGTFSIDIMLPKEYPFVPPKMKFSTKIWHPNISSQSGAICLDILKNEWSPALTVRTALISLQALMSAPEPDDPQDAVVAKQYKENQTDFVATAKYWTEIYAMRAPRTRSARAARPPLRCGRRALPLSPPGDSQAERR